MSITQNQLEEAALNLVNEQNKLLVNNQTTLRDEFAMAALPLFFNSGVAGERYWREAIASLVYKMADSMLEARKAKGE